MGSPGPLRELTDTELDAVSGGAAAAAATSSGTEAAALAQGGTG
jgi:bacteriocin-like protein